MYIIYCIFFDKNIYGFNSDHYYIGQHKTNNLNDTYMGSGKAVKDIYRTYGSEKAQKSVLAICDDKKLVDLLEIEFIKIYRQEYGNKVLNIANGGNCVSLPKEYMIEAHKKTNAANRKLWKEHPERFLERNKKISEKMKGNRNGSFRKVCLNKKKTIISKKDYSGRKNIIKTPNPLGKWKSKTRGMSVSKAQMEKVYFYSFQTKEYKEFESIKTGWKEMGFSSESTALRFCRYCTKLLENNTLDSFETPKAVKIEAFVAKIPYNENLNKIDLLLEKDFKNRPARLDVLEQERRRKIAEYNLTKRVYHHKNKEVLRHVKN